MGQNISSRRSYTPGKTKNTEVAWPAPENGSATEYGKGSATENGSASATGVGHSLDIHEDGEKVDIVTLSTPSDTPTSSSTPAGKTEKRKRFRVGFPLRRTPSGRWSRKRKSLPQNGVRPASGGTSVHEELPETTVGPRTAHDVLTQQPDMPTNGHVVHVTGVTANGGSHSNLKDQDKPVKASAKSSWRRGSQKSSSKRKKKEKQNSNNKKKNKKQNSGGDGKVREVMMHEMTDRETDGLKDAPGEEVLAQTQQSINDVQSNAGTIGKDTVSAGHGQEHEKTDDLDTSRDPTDSLQEHTDHSFVDNRGLCLGNHTLPVTAEVGKEMADNGRVTEKQAINNDIKYFMDTGEVMADNGHVTGTRDINNDIEYFMDAGREEVPENTSETSLGSALHIKVLGGNIPRTSVGDSLPLVGNTAFGYEAPSSSPPLQATEGESTAEVQIQEHATMGAGSLIDLPSAAMSKASPFLDVSVDDTSRGTPSLHLTPSVAPPILPLSEDLVPCVEPSKVPSSLDLSLALEGPSRPTVSVDTNTQTSKVSVPLELAASDEHSEGSVSPDPATIGEASTSLDDLVHDRPSHVSHALDLSAEASGFLDTPISIENVKQLLPQNLGYDISEHSESMLPLDISAVCDQHSLDLGSPSGQYSSNLSFPSGQHSLDLSSLSVQHSLDLGSSSGQVSILPLPLDHGTVSSHHPIVSLLVDHGSTNNGYYQVLPPAHPADVSDTAANVSLPRDPVFINCQLPHEPLPGDLDNYANGGHSNVSSSLVPVIINGQPSTGSPANLVALNSPPMDLLRSLHYDCVNDEVSQTSRDLARSYVQAGSTLHIQSDNESNAKCLQTFNGSTISLTMAKPWDELARDPCPVSEAVPETVPQNQTAQTLQGVLDDVVLLRQEAAPGMETEASYWDVSPTDKIQVDSQHQVNVLQQGEAEVVFGNVLWTSSMQHPETCGGLSHGRKHGEVAGKLLELEVPTDVCAGNTVELDVPTDVCAGKLLELEVPTGVCAGNTLELDVPTDVCAGKLLKLDVPTDVCAGNTVELDVPTDLCAGKLLELEVPTDVCAGNTVELDVPTDVCAGKLLELEVPTGVCAGNTLELDVPTDVCAGKLLELDVPTDVCAGNTLELDVPTDVCAVNILELDVPTDVCAGNTLELDVPTDVCAGNTLELDVPTDVCAGKLLEFEVPTDVCSGNTLELNVSTDVCAGNTLELDVPTDVCAGNTLELDVPTDVCAGNTLELEVPTDVWAGNTLELDVPTDVCAGKLLELEVPTDVCSGNTLELNVSTDVCAGNTLELDVPTDVCAGNTLELDVPTDVCARNTLELDVPTDVCAGNTMELEVPTDLCAEKLLELDVPTDVCAGNTLELDVPTDVCAGNTLELDVPTDVCAGNILKLEVPTDVRAGNTLELGVPAGRGDTVNEIVQVRVTPEKPGVEGSEKLESDFENDLNILEINQEKCDKRPQETEHINNQQKNMSTLNTGTATHKQRKDKEQRAAGKKEKGHSKGKTLMKFQRKLTDWFHKTDKKLEADENDKVETPDTSDDLSKADGTTAGRSALMKAEEPREATEYSQLCLSTEIQPGISAVSNTDNFILHFKREEKDDATSLVSSHISDEPADIPTPICPSHVSSEPGSIPTPTNPRQILTEPADIPTPNCPNHVSNEPDKISTPTLHSQISSQRHYLPSPICHTQIPAEPANTPTPSDPTSPSSDTSRLASPSSDGEGSNFLKKISLGPRLRTAILRKKSTDSPEGDGEEKRISLTRPKSIGARDLTPSSLKLSPREPVVHSSPSTNRALNRIFMFGVSNYDIHTTSLDTISRPTSVTSSIDFNNSSYLNNSCDFNNSCNFNNSYVPENTSPSLADDNRVYASNEVSTSDSCALVSESVTDSSLEATENWQTPVVGLVSHDNEENTCPLLNASINDEDKDESDKATSFNSVAETKCDRLGISDPKVEFIYQNPVSPESTVEITQETPVSSLLVDGVYCHKSVFSEPDEDYLWKPVPLKSETDLSLKSESDKNCHKVELNCEQLGLHDLDAGLRCDNETVLYETVGAINCDNTVMSESQAEVPCDRIVICELQTDINCDKTIMSESQEVTCERIVICKLQTDINCDKTILPEPRFDIMCNNILISKPEAGINCDKPVLLEPDVEINCDTPVLPEPDVEVYCDKPVLLVEPDVEVYCDKTILGELNVEVNCDKPVLPEPDVEINCDKIVVSKSEAGWLLEPKVEVHCDKPDLPEPYIDVHCDTPVLPEPVVEVNCDKPVLPEPEVEVHCDTTVLPEPDVEINCDKPVLPEPDVEINCDKPVLPEPDVEINCDRPVLPEPEVEVHCNTPVLPEPDVEVHCDRPVLPEPEVEVHCNKHVLPEAKVEVQCEKPVLPEPEVEVHCGTPVLPEPEVKVHCNKPVLPEPEVEVHCNKPVLPEPEVEVHCNKPVLPESEVEVHCDKPVLPEPEVEINCDKAILSEPEINCDKRVLPEPETAINCDKPVLPEPGDEVHCDKLLLPESEIEAKCDRIILPDTKVNCDKTVSMGPEAGISCHKTILSEPEPGIVSELQAGMNSHKMFVSELQIRINCDKSGLPQCTAAINCGGLVLTDKQAGISCDNLVLSEPESGINCDKFALFESGAGSNCETLFLSGPESGINCDNLVLPGPESGINCDNLALHEPESGINCNNFVLPEPESGINCDNLVLTEQESGINCDNTVPTEREMGAISGSHALSSHPTRLGCIEPAKISSSITAIPNQTAIPSTASYRDACMVSSVTNGETENQHKVPQSTFSKDNCISVASIVGLSGRLSTTSIFTWSRTTHSVLENSHDNSTHEHNQPASERRPCNTRVSPSAERVSPEVYGKGVCSSSEHVLSEVTAATSQSVNGSSVCAENDACPTDNPRKYGQRCGHSGVRTIAEYKIGILADPVEDVTEPWTLTDDDNSSREAPTSDMAVGLSSRSDSALTGRGSTQP